MTGLERSIVGRLQIRWNPASCSGFKATQSAAVFEGSKVNNDVKPQEAAQVGARDRALFGIAAVLIVLGVLCAMMCLEMLMECC